MYRLVVWYIKLCVCVHVRVCTIQEVPTDHESIPEDYVTIPEPFSNDNYVTPVPGPSSAGDSAMAGVDNTSVDINIDDPFMLVECKANFIPHLNDTKADKLY